MAFLFLFFELKKNETFCSILLFCFIIIINIIFTYSQSKKVIAKESLQNHSTFRFCCCCCWTSSRRKKWMEKNISLKNQNYPNDDTMNFGKMILHTHWIQKQARNKKNITLFLTLSFFFFFFFYTEDLLNKYENNKQTSDGKKVFFSFSFFSGTLTHRESFCFAFSFFCHFSMCVVHHHYYHHQNQKPAIKIKKKARLIL